MNTLAEAKLEKVSRALLRRARSRADHEFMAVDQGQKAPRRYREVDIRAGQHRLFSSALSGKKSKVKAERRWLQHLRRIGRGRPPSRYGFK